MKSLKFNHQSAQKISNLKKLVTWRIYDDKNLQVDDTFEIIDKVEVGNQDSWQIIAQARIDRIVATRLQDVLITDPRDSLNDVGGADPLDWAHQQYGSDVTKYTVVKIITSSIKQANSDVVTTPSLHEAKLYTDGGSRGNPGPSACGYVILSMDDEIVAQKGTYIGVTTNNQAEYQALKSGLEELRRMGVARVHVYMDSLLVINQMQGVYKVKNRDLWPIHESIKGIVATFSRVTFTHVPRELNKLADSAVNRALDEAISP